MERVTVRAYAKVNLTLDVKGKRADGYHQMDMLMQSVGLYDTLTIEKQAAGLSFFCDAAHLPQGADNLAVRAAQAFFARTHAAGGARITLKKRIPSGAGMAGGSADAAGVLAGLNALYGARLSPPELCAMGITLGADVPFCLVGATARVTGIGEEIRPIPPLSGGAFAAVKPDFSINTREAFARFDEGSVFCRPDTDRAEQAICKGDLQLLGTCMMNVFEQTETLPEIRRVKETLLRCGAYGAIMTGSGSVIYGLFPDRQTAKRAYLALDGFGEARYVFEPVAQGIAVME